MGLAYERRKLMLMESWFAKRTTIPFLTTVFSLFGNSPYASSASLAATSSTCPSTLTFGQTAAIFPDLSIRNVAR